MPGLAEVTERRVARTPIAAGEPVIEARLLPLGKQAGITSLTPSGHRTQWLPVDDGVAGLGLVTGDHVDLYATDMAPRAKGRTKLLVEGAFVLEVTKAKPIAPARVTFDRHAEVGQGDGEGARLAQ